LTDTEYTYNDQTSLPDNLTEVQVCDSTCSGNGSNTVSQTNYNYIPSATTTSGIPNHQVPADTYLSKPYLGSTQQWISSGNSLTTTYTNDDTGAQLTSTDPNGQTTFGRDSTDSYVTTMTPPTPSSGVSLPQSAAYDPSTGLVTSTTDPNGERTTYTYDWAGRPLTIHYPDGGTETFGYPPNAVVDTHTMSASESAQTQTLYDSYGRLSRVEVANGQGTNPWYQTDYCYDANGRLSFQSYQYQGLGGTQASVCSGAGDAYSYDALGRPTQVLHGDGSAITYAYAGRATRVTDENGVSRISQVDGLGRTTAVCEISSNSSMPGGSGSPASCGLDLPGTGFLTTYTYMLAAHQVKVNQGGQIRSFMTDGAGRTVSVTEPESGTTNYSYAYAGSGGLGLTVTRTRPQANQTNSSVLTTTATQYDSVGRPVTISYNDGITPNRYFLYDQSTLAGVSGGTSTGAGKGRMTEAATTSEAEAFVYDPMGRILNEAQCIPGGCGSAAYYVPFSYDWMGNVTSADDGSGAVSTYMYSPAGEVTSITGSLNDSTHQPNLVSNVLNGPNGPVSWQLGNGLSVLRLYDSLGRTQQEWVCNVTASIGCGASGNVLNGYFVNWRGTQASYTSDTFWSQDRDYTYDDFNRLTSMTDSDTGQQLYNWVYDRWGNRWQQNASTGGFSFLTNYNTSANQINALGYTYDAAGNLINDSTFAYTYDAEGNMLNFGPSDGSGSPATYQYNALNQRVRLDQGGASAGFVFNPTGQRSTIWNMATGVESRGDTYWGSVPVEFNGEFDGSNQSNYVHRDWQNTETVITAANGLAEANLHYLPYGDFSGWGGTPLNPPAFAGMDEEYYNWADSGMDHGQFRQYHNWYGHWMSPDPSSGSYDFSNPQSLNRYTYAMNNPNVFTDPSGLGSPCDPIENDGPCPAPDPPINPCDYPNCLLPLSPTGPKSPSGPGWPTVSSFISHSRPENCAAQPRSLGKDIQSMQNAFNQTIQSMNQQGRVPMSGTLGGVINNIWQCIRNPLNPSQLGCGGQAAQVYGVVNNLPLQNTWSIQMNYVYLTTGHILPHQYVTASTSCGLTVQMDPWKNSFQVIP
jgi:RHS repeat-associated protein